MTKNKKKKNPPIGGIKKIKPSRRKVGRTKKVGLSMVRSYIQKSSQTSNESVNKPKTVYVLNPDFGSFYELRDLILKSLPAEKDNMVKRLNRLGKIKLAVISGIFINKENLDPLITDLLIVGDYIDSRKLRSFLKSLEAEVGKEVKYSVMDKEEFQYRLAMFDRFVRVILEAPHEKLINKLGI